MPLPVSPQRTVRDYSVGPIQPRKGLVRFAPVGMRLANLEGHADYGIYDVARIAGGRHIGLS